MFDLLIVNLPRVCGAKRIFICFFRGCWLYYSTMFSYWFIIIPIKIIANFLQKRKKNKPKNKKRNKQTHTHTKTYTPRINISIYKNGGKSLVLLKITTKRNIQYVSFES